MPRKQRKGKPSWRRDGWEVVLIRMRSEVLEVIDEQVKGRNAQCVLGEPRTTRTSLIMEALNSYLVIDPHGTAVTREMEIPEVGELGGEG